MIDGKLRRTPLFAAHQRLGGKLIEFGGWEMPVQYTSIVDEHLAVRKAAGLFDISHMGEELVTGTGAEEFLNRTLTNDIRKLAVGQGQYTLMCHETGGVIDDLYAYRLESNSYLLIINASRISEDVAWLEKQLAGRDAQNPVRLQNSSDATGALAVQGPRVGDSATRRGSRSPQARAQSRLLHPARYAKKAERMVRKRHMEATTGNTEATGIFTIVVSDDVKALVHAEARAYCDERKIRHSDFNQDCCAFTAFRALVQAKKLKRYAQVGHTMPRSGVERAGEERL